MNDMSENLFGYLRAWFGRGGKLAVEDSVRLPRDQGRNRGCRHQNKPDVGANIANWIDVDKVDVIVDGLTSSIASR